MELPPIPEPEQVMEVSPPALPPVLDLAPEPPIELPRFDPPRDVKAPVLIAPTPTKPKSEGTGIVWVAMLCLAGFISYMLMGATQSSVATANPVPKPSPAVKTTSIAPAAGSQGAGERLADEALQSPSPFGEAFKASNEAITKRDDHYTDLQDQLSALHDQQDEVRPGSAEFERLQKQVDAKEREIEASAK
jgi:hypothetical protein